MKNNYLGVPSINCRILSRLTTMTTTFSSVAQLPQMRIGFGDDRKPRQLNDLASVIQAMVTQIENLGKNDFSESKFHKDDVILIRSFQKKFLLVENDWSLLAKTIVDIIFKLEEKYGKCNFMGLKEILTFKILNVLTSYIIIGKYTSHGSGIDNIYGPNKHNCNPKYNNVMLEDRIMNFLKMLNDQMSGVYAKYVLMKMTAKQYDNSLAEFSKTQKKVEMLQPYYRHAGYDKHDSNKLDQLYLEKTNAHADFGNQLKTILEPVESFSCFMHDEYPPILDHDLPPPRSWDNSERDRRYFDLPKKSSFAMTY